MRTKTVNEHTLRCDAIKALLDYEKIPKGRGGIGPWYELQEYRGKRQYTVGYRWNRMYAHHAKGLVYMCVLGWGETFDAAFARFRKGPFARSTNTSISELPGKWDQLIDDFGERNERGPLRDAIRELIAVNDRLRDENRATGAGARAVTQAARISALNNLIYEAMSERTSRSAYARILRALKGLGFTPEEASKTLYYLDYHDREGKPFPYLMIEKPMKGKKK